MACTLDADLLQILNGNDEVIIIVDIRRIWKMVRTKIVPMSCKGDLDLRPETHERILGTPQNLDDRTRTNLQTFLVRSQKTFT